MNVLVTGGLGVVGSQFAEHMLALGYSVHVIDAAEKPRNGWIEMSLQKRWGATKRLTIEKSRIEIDSPARWVPAIDKSDLVLHAAASTGIPHSADDPNDDWASNVDATKTLLEALRLSPKRPPFVALSSVKPYGLKRFMGNTFQSNTRWGLASWSPFRGVNESFPLEPDEPYAASKAAQSMLCMAWARSFDLPVVVLRCSNLYGPAPCHGPRHGWLTWFCISAAMGRPIEIQGSGTQTRDMLYTDDVTRAVIAAKASIETVRGRVFNIGGGVENTISVIEAAQLIEEKARAHGIEVAQRSAPGRKHEDMLFVTDYALFHEATGWKPHVSVQEGVDAILAWAVPRNSELRDIYGVPA